jgi:predicted DNA-binding transcriptional regulator AlpA
VARPELRTDHTGALTVARPQVLSPVKPQRPKRPKREAWPRWLRRADASDYLSISPAQLDTWVTERTVPKPQKIGGLVLYDRHALDASMGALFYPEADLSAWDDVRA